MDQIDGVLSYSCDGTVAQIGLNRPKKRNAINDQLIEALSVGIARANAEAKAAVLFGHGPHFCAGLDLAEHAERDALAGIRNSRRWHAVFAEMEFAPIPWVAALHGAVVGGGLEIACATHIRVAAAGAFFALPEGQRGIYVGGGASVRLARLIGPARMADMMLSGRVARADEAERWGMVQYVTEADSEPADEAFSDNDAARALAGAARIARQAAGNAPFSNYAVIHALPRIQDMSREDGLMVEAMVASLATGTEEAKARLRSFLDGRAGKVAPDAPRQDGLGRESTDSGSA
ncbi:MAG: crotonase/enoyl-CoA hydratase family protein [Pseudomonadota bacterium]